MDVADVNPTLLKRLNALGKAHKQVVTIFSGYRSPDYNRQVGGASHSLHTEGKAVDATINGQPIGSVIGQDEFVKYKLRNGNQPNFYKGQPDPAHTDLGTAGGGATAPAPPADTAQPAPVPAGTTPSQQQLPNPYGQPPPVPGGLSSQGPTAPGSVPAEGFDRRWLAQTWEQIANLPGSGPEAQQYLQLAKQAGG